MHRTLYVRPVGIIEPRGVTADEAPAAMLPLAGGPLAFTAVEVIERGTGDAVVRRTCGLGDVYDRDWGRQTLVVSDLVEAIRAPRPRLAGLSLDRPRIMGIVNVTPDSFSDGGRLGSVDAAVDHALRLAAAGADILDIGGESTRPGSDAVAVKDELARVLPVIEALRPKTEKPISIDTRKAEVMRQAVAAGADIINDVSALTHDKDAIEVAAAAGCHVILMHAQGDPKTMNDDPRYSEVTLDVFDYLEQRIDTCIRAGIARSRLVVDPGIGFGKHLPHNVAVLGSLALYHALGVPVLLGASRKKLIGQLCNVEAPQDRVAGSIAAALAGVAQGVQIVRVHDVAETHQAISVWRAATAGCEPAV